MRAFLVSLLFCVLLAVPGCAAQQTVFSLAANNVLTVTTERYTATVENGCLTGLANTLTGEVYATASPELGKRLPNLIHGLSVYPADASDALKREQESAHGWLSGYGMGTQWSFMHHPGATSTVTMQKLAADHVRVTWKGLEAVNPVRTFPDETFTLDLAVLPGSGDLAISVITESPTPGVMGNGFVMANFSRDLTVIRPVGEGSSFVPRKEKPAASVVTWPTPWEASLLVLESNKGAVGLWMEDTTLRPRYLHTRNNEQAYDVVFESTNDAPFDTYMQAVSRPIRINVFKGNWVSAATPFKTWWARAFKVEPIEKRTPGWLKDLRWIVHWPAPPEKTYGPKTVFFAPQCWKVGPKAVPGIDGGLFPEDMSKGPELNGWDKNLQALKDIGSHAYVYLNIDYMNKNHPWAPKYWDARIVPTFTNRAGKETEPGPGAQGAYLVNCAHKPWQDLIVDWAKQTYDKYGITGFYMDCAAGHAALSNGVIDGKNDCQGQVELMRRIKETVPGAFLDCEFLNEVTAQVVDIGSVGYDYWWPGSQDARQRTVHPIMGFLYSDYLYVHYISPPTLPGFDEVMGRLTHTGAEPALPANSITDYSVTTTFDLYRAKLMCDTLMKPVYPTTWAPTVRAYYADPQGNRYEVRAENPDEGRLVQIAKDGTESLSYWRIKGREKAEGLNPDTGIEGWIAYDEKNTALGLDPKKDYFYAAKPRITDWVVTELSEGIILSSTRPYTDGLLVLDLRTTDGQARTGSITLATKQHIATVITSEGKVLPAIPKRLYEDGMTRFMVQVQAPGVVLFSTQEPTAAELPAEGFSLAKLGVTYYANINEYGVREPIAGNRLPAIDAQTNIRVFPRWTHAGALDYLVRLPAVPEGKKLLLKFASNVPHDSNSYEMVVTVNGKELLRDKRTGKRGDYKDHVVELTPNAGKPVHLALVFDHAGLFDWIRVKNPVLTAE